MKPSHIVWLCNGGMACIAFAPGLMPVYLTSFSEAFGGLNEEQLGRFSAAFFGSALIGILIGGPLADRFGAKLFAVMGLLLTTFGLILIAIAQSYGTMLLACGTIGLGAGVLDMLMSPIVSAVSVGRRSAAMNQLHAFYCVGLVATVLVASAGLWVGLGWRVVAGGLVVLPAILTIAFLRAPLPPLVHPEFARHGLRKMLRMPRFYMALVMIAFVGATEEGMAQWLPAYAERTLGLSRAMSGLGLAAFALAAVTGRMLAPRILARVEAHGLVCVAASACGLLYLLAAWAPTALVGFVACMLVGLTVSVLWPTNLGITADQIPQGGATMFAVLSAAGNFGCLVMPWTTGAIAEVTSLNWAIAVGAACPLLLAGVMAVVWRRDAQEAHSFRKGEGLRS